MEGRSVAAAEEVEDIASARDPPTIPAGPTSHPRPAPLPAHPDRYDGVIVDEAGLPTSPDEFTERLRHSLDIWRQEGRRGIWLKLETSKAAFVPIAIQAGFQYHHAESAYVMLTYWLPESPSPLPPNASHQVGVGAFVLNNQGEVLAVMERHGPLRGMGVWKMPTGILNQGEDLGEAAVREVMEETGIEAEFVDIIAYRHIHDVSFGKSDLFFICSLRPLSSQVTACQQELEDAQWMSLDEMCAQPFVRDRPMSKAMMDACLAHAAGRQPGFKGQQLQGYYPNTTCYLYSAGEQERAKI